VGSALYADGKIYVSDEDGVILIFKAARIPPVKKDVIEHEMDSASYLHACAGKRRTLHHDPRHLFAIRKACKAKPVKPE